MSQELLGTQVNIFQVMEVCWWWLANMTQRAVLGNVPSAFRMLCQLSRVTVGAGAVNVASSPEPGNCSHLGPCSRISASVS